MEAFEQLKVCQEVHSKLAFVERYLLAHTCFEHQLLNIVFFVGGVHHDGQIVCVSLFSNASIDSQKEIAFGIYFEG